MKFLKEFLFFEVKSTLADLGLLIIFWPRGEKRKLGLCTCHNILFIIMNTLSLIFIVILSILFGVFLCFVGLWFTFKYYSKPSATSIKQEEDHLIPNIGQFHLPQVLLDLLEASDTPKKETCIALNLIFHFLFHELRNSDEVRTWFLKKLSLEFDELLTRSTTGKLIDKITIRELDLGSKFPTLSGVSVQDVQLHPTQRHIETLDLSLDLQYEGGFQLGTNAKLLLGASALVSVKVTHLSGQARLRFTRQPYSHWSFTFYSEPSLELQVDSQFQGRPIPQVTSLIINQIRKAVKKKHTIPQFKLRYKPFFQPPSAVCVSLLADNSSVLPSATLSVSLVECTRLNPQLLAGDVYCTLAVDEAPWVELVQTDSFAVMTVDLILKKRSSQSLGVTFKPDSTSMVCVDHVDQGSPAFMANLKKGDILLNVQGTKITSLNQASKLMRSAGNRFSLRVERKRNLLSSSKKDSSFNEDTTVSQPGSPSHLRRRHVSEQQLSQTAPSESESSGSSNTSPSNSPAKKPNVSLQPTRLQTPEGAAINISRKSSCVGPTLSGIQIYRTKELPVCSDLTFNESVTFHIGDNVGYFNIGIWSTQQTTDSNNKDVLLGHLSIPLQKIVDKCTMTGLGHFIKKWQLQEPCLASKPHNLTGHSGFEPGLCFGDVLLCFVLIPDQAAANFSASSSNITSTSTNSSPRATASLKSDLEPESLRGESPIREIPTPNSLSLNQDDTSVHDFVRTHFSRATQCDFCSKKIWLKDAVQCRSCRMTCHKKCVTKCQASAVCIPSDEPLLNESQPNSQGPSPTKAPEIITTSVETEMNSPTDPSATPQGAKRGLGGLLASVANAAHARGIKRTGSASNLAPPCNEGTPGSPSSSSRSLPHSPQLSPSVSRKTSLADASLFELPGELAALDEAADELRIEEALETLLQRQYDNEDIMTVAKDTGKQLYSGLPKRKDKINKLISKLKVAMDRETQIQEALEAEAEDASDKAQRAFLLGHSEQRVQAITVLLLHCCAGLQHVQDTEEEEEHAAKYLQVLEASESAAAMI